MWKSFVEVDWANLKCRATLTWLKYINRNIYKYSWNKSQIKKRSLKFALKDKNILCCPQVFREAISFISGESNHSIISFLIKKQKTNLVTLDGLSVPLCAEKIILLLELNKLFENPLGLAGKCVVGHFQNKWWSYKLL